MRIAGKAKVDEIQDESDAVSLCSLYAGSEMFGIDTSKIREVLTTVNLRALLGVEAHPGRSCVLVMEDDEAAERFGLVVDAVGGVVVVNQSALEDNPCTLEARGKWLFDGAYKMESGLMIRLDPQKLSPSRLSETGLFKKSSNGGADASLDR